MPKFWRRKKRNGKLGDVWWTNLNGKRTTTGCSDQRAAEAWRRRQERERADPRNAAAAKATWGDAVRDMSAELVRRGSAKATLVRCKQKLGHAVRLWGADCAMYGIDAALLAKYVDTRVKEEAAPLTIRDELAFIRQTLALSRRFGNYPMHVDDVMPRFHAPYKPVERKLTPAALPLLLEHLRADHAAHVCFMVATGARLSESYRATWESVDLKSWIVKLTGTKTKGSTRTVPIAPFLRPWLRRAMKGAIGVERLFPYWHKIQRDMAGACVRAGVPTVGPNDLRRTFATWHILEGYEPSVVAVLLGHATDELVQRVYGKVKGEEIAHLVFESPRGIRTHPVSAPPKPRKKGR